MRHRTQRTHAAIGFVAAPLIELYFARRLFRAREQTADHDYISASGDDFRKIARETNAAIRDHADISIF